MIPSGKLNHAPASSSAGPRHRFHLGCQFCHHQARAETGLAVGAGRGAFCARGLSMGVLHSASKGAVASDRTLWPSDLCHAVRLPVHRHEAWHERGAVVAHPAVAGVLHHWPVGAAAWRAADDMAAGRRLACLCRRRRGGLQCRRRCQRDRSCPARCSGGFLGRRQHRFKTDFAAFDDSQRAWTGGVGQPFRTAGPAGGRTGARSRSPRFELHQPRLGISRLDCLHRLPVDPARVRGLVEFCLPNIRYRRSRRSRCWCRCSVFWARPCCSANHCKAGSSVPPALSLRACASICSGRG
ncbi:hypothetical protein MAUB1S_06519 [Mycolicibacterium aubagnense]